MKRRQNEAVPFDCIICTWEIKKAIKKVSQSRAHKMELLFFSEKKVKTQTKCNAFQRSWFGLVKLKSHCSPFEHDVFERWSSAQHWPTYAVVFISTSDVETSIAMDSWFGRRFERSAAAIERRRCEIEMARTAESRSVLSIGMREVCLDWICARIGTCLQHFESKRNSANAGRSHWRCVVAVFRTNAVAFKATRTGSPIDFQCLVRSPEWNEIKAYFIQFLISCYSFQIQIKNRTHTCSELISRLKKVECEKKRKQNDCDRVTFESFQQKRCSIKIEKQNFVKVNKFEKAENEENHLFELRIEKRLFHCFYRLI